MEAKIDKKYVQHWERFANVNILLDKHLEKNNIELYKSLRHIVSFYKECTKDSINKEIFQHENRY